MAMALDGAQIDRSVWISELTPPLQAKDLAQFFSRVGKVEDVVIPDVDGTEALLIFVSDDLVDTALTYSGRPFRDSKIVVEVPSAAQIGQCRVELDPLNKPNVATPSSPAAVEIERLKTSVLKGGISHPEIVAMIGVLQEAEKETRAETYSLTAHNKPKQEQSGGQPDNSRMGQLGGDLEFIAGNDRYSDVAGHESRSVVQGMQYPRVSNFSGDGDKGDISFLQWRNEVHWLLSEQQPNTHVLHAIRRSLRGTAAEVLLNLGQGVSPLQILEKFDVVFGTALTSQSLLEDFYSTHQKEEENVVRWGCRLESLLNLVKEKGLFSDNTEAMKRSKFWSGLKDEHVKGALRHRFDTGESYQGLLTAARAVEHEQWEQTKWNEGKPEVSTQARKHGGKQAKVQVQEVRVPSNVESKLEELINLFKEEKKAKVQVQQTGVPSSMEQKLDEMLTGIRNLTGRVDYLEKSSKSHAIKKKKPKQGEDTPSTTSNTETRDCYYCKESGHLIADCKKLAAKKRAENRQEPAQ